MVLEDRQMTIRSIWSGSRSWSRNETESDSWVDSLAWSKFWEFDSLWAKSWTSFICFCSVWSRTFRWTAPKSEAWRDGI